MSSTTASTTIRALRFLFATHGLSEVIVSDSGPQFVAQEMKDFQKSNGIRHYLSAPYHPASTGEAERPNSHPIGRLASRFVGQDVEKTKLGNHTTRPKILPGDPVMVRDYRDHKRPWIKGVLQDRVGPVTYHVMVGNLFWKRHVNQLRSLAGSKVVDTEPMAEIPFDDAYPEVIPMRPPEAPPVESSDSQAVYNHVVPPRPQGSPNLVPVSATEAPDLSAVPPPQMPSVSRTEEPAKVTEEPAKVQVRKRYPTRLRGKPKRLIEDM